MPTMRTAVLGKSGPADQPIQDCAVALCGLSTIRTTLAPSSKSTQNAPPVRCAFIVELMCAFTLLALRCVNTFYPKRLKDVETINQIQYDVSSS